MFTKLAYELVIFWRNTLRFYRTSRATLTQQQVFICPVDR